MAGEEKRANTRKTLRLIWLNTDRGMAPYNERLWVPFELVAAQLISRSWLEPARIRRHSGGFTGVRDIGEDRPAFQNTFVFQRDVKHTKNTSSDTITRLLKGHRTITTFSSERPRVVNAVFTRDTFTWDKLTFLLYCYILLLWNAFTSRKRLSCKHGISMAIYRKKIWAGGALIGDGALILFFQ